MRLPTPNVSLIELVFCTKKDLNIKSKKMISTIFNYYLINYDKIKEKHSSVSKERNICDFIAGMTDKYAINIYEKII